ncbi:uncharacterized protein N7529_011871 [Penicillium soppii]|jgi:hypothetical protein|uniref:uncharacterized protein n=1 Tax=Penicillium soppii TaxID=69789 RepID=UPI002546C027|nr:uncharacterized protein N7529_011871 [Penicillium soppii]KAJ5852486.1 hypothetical protein N7529_011871 [Penicillium soppii]
MKEYYINAIQDHKFREIHCFRLAVRLWIGLRYPPHIDAFAFDMAWEDKANDASVEIAFTAANEKRFKLFFSFDYAGNGS